MVFPGFSPTRAKFFRFKMRLITEDFPTLDLPAKAISGRRSLGKPEVDAALNKKKADMMPTILNTIPEDVKNGPRKPGIRQ